jgi:hypothetical protein
VFGRNLVISLVRVSGIGSFRVEVLWQVGVVGVLPGWSWDSVRVGSCVFVFIVGLSCVDDYLRVGCYLFGGRVSDGGEVGLVLGPRLEAGCSF